MPEIALVLSAAGTSAPDFTLHDSDHAFRVARRMSELLPDDLKETLGSFEIVLLLLSAYLHDIGMSPNRGVVQRHFEYIQTAADGLLDPAEIERLENWIDEEWDGIDLPIAGATPTPDKIRTAEKLLAYYCRHRHNDWSAVWIHKNIVKFQPSLYQGWIDDLIALCQSHHEGLSALRQPRFDARIVGGSPPQNMNLRYLAAVLRVADVLELDPERTPSVILEHRNVDSSSVAYWMKDHTISIHLDKEKWHRILFIARPSSARLFKAVRDTAEDINKELVCCHALESEGDFQRGTFLRDKFRYHWPWLPRLTESTTEADESFVFIDGAFRPDGERVLKLLTGTPLYGSPMVAVRELLQNAADAVNEQIAHEILSRGKDFQESALRLGHSVTIKLRKRKDAWWLICNDTGAGMTKQIISDFFLVGGASQRPDIRRLERESRRHGFLLERTGQFGIGVLSYFMLADGIRVMTRRSQEAGDDPDRTGWRFETAGPGSFGQLSKDERQMRGTAVELRLRSELLSEGGQRFFSDLVQFVNETIVSYPCRLRVEAGDPPGPVMGGPGWFKTPDDIVGISESWLDADERLKSAQSGLVPQRVIVEHETRLQNWITVRDRLLQHLRWFGPEEGALRSVRGRYRLHLPYFDVNGQPCLGFMDHGEKGYTFLPTGAW